jgi:hypothetical protein
VTAPPTAVVPARTVSPTTAAVQRTEATDEPRAEQHPAAPTPVVPARTVSPTTAAVQRTEATDEPRGEQHTAAPTSVVPARTVSPTTAAVQRTQATDEPRAEQHTATPTPVLPARTVSPTTAAAQRTEATDEPRAEQHTAAPTPVVPARTVAPSPSPSFVPATAAVQRTLVAIARPVAASSPSASAEGPHAEEPTVPAAPVVSARVVAPSSPPAPTDELHGEHRIAPPTPVVPARATTTTRVQRTTPTSGTNAPGVQRSATTVVAPIVPVRETRVASSSQTTNRVDTSVAHDPEPEVTSPEHVPIVRSGAAALRRPGLDIHAALSGIRVSPAQSVAEPAPVPRVARTEPDARKVAALPARRPGLDVQLALAASGAPGPRPALQLAPAVARATHAEEAIPPPPPPPTLAAVTAPPDAPAAPPVVQRVTTESPPEQTEHRRLSEAPDDELEELAGRLYDHIRSRFRAELLVDRERAGLLASRY